MCGSLRGCQHGGRVDFALSPGEVGPAGVEEHGICTGGFPRNLRDPVVAFPQFLAWGCQTQSSRPRAGVGSAGANTGAREGTAKRRNTEVRPDQRRDVGALRSTDEAGELEPREPWGGKGEPSHETVGGKHGGCTETREPVNATTTDSRAGEAIPTT